METLQDWQVGFFFIQIFQFVFFTAHSFIYKRKEYVYYTMYILFSTLYVIGLSSLSTEFESFVPVSSEVLIYLDKPLAFVSYFFYFKFAKYFLEIPYTNPALAKKIRIVEFIILFFALSIFITTYLFGRSTNEVVFSIFSAISIPLAFYSVVSFLKLGIKGFNYFIIIGASLIIFAAISTFLIIKLQQFYPVLNSYPITLHYHFVIILELLVFSIGLGFKAYKMEYEKRKLDKLLINELIEKQNIQSNLEVVREKIARDIHDDIGASLSGISILSNIENSKRKNENINEISIIAEDLMTNLREAMWFLKTKNDSINGLISQLEKEWKSILRAKNMTILFSTNFNDCKISILQKKNLYLICKEAINNCIKHSHGSHIFLDFKVDNEILKMSISDNGLFRIPADGHIGYGLENMETRIQEIKGKMTTRCVSGSNIVLNFSFQL